MRFLLIFTAATALAQPSARILITYDSSATTEIMAQTVRQGAALVENVELTVRKMADVSDDDIVNAEGIMVGTTVQFLNLSAETKTFMDRVPAVLAAAKIDAYSDYRTAAVYCAGNDRAGGKDLARLSVLNHFVGIGFIAIGASDRTSGIGTLGPDASTTTATPGAGVMTITRNFGTRFAFVTREIRKAAAAAAGATAISRSTRPADPERPPTRILVAYYSLTGNTEKLAQAIQQGAAAVPGVEVMLRKIEDVTDDEIMAADSMLLGTPVHWLNLSAEMKTFLGRVGALLYFRPDPNIKLFRTGGAFCTGGDTDSGKDLARLSILNGFLGMSFLAVGGPPPSYLGAEATDGSVNAQALANAQSFGERFARVTRQVQPAPAPSGAAAAASPKKRQP